MATTAVESVAVEAVEMEDAEADNAVDEAPVNPNVSAEHSECLDDPNFATICSFLEKFGELVRLGELPFDELQAMLENTTEVPDALVKLHVSLLRRVFKSITPDKWEKSLAKFGHTYCNQDGWEIERFGYKQAKLQTKLRILKNLLEAQFDFNVKFKSEVNKLQASDLRLIPLGRDCEGQVYWYQVDNDANLRVYREDIDDETWEIVASTREEFCELITKLQKGDVKRPAEAIVIDEDSNEKEIETKEIILDTGKVEEEEDDDDEEEESEETDEESEEEQQEDCIVAVKSKVPPKLSPVPKIIPPECPPAPIKEVVPAEEPPKLKANEMEVEEEIDHSDEMEIDESPQKLSESDPIEIEKSEKSDDVIRAVNVEPSKLNFNQKPKSDVTTGELVKVQEEAVVKSEVLKSEQVPYQKVESKKAIVTGKPSLISASEPTIKNDQVKVVNSVSVMEKSESEIIIKEKPNVVIESGIKDKSIEPIADKSKEIKVDETIIITKPKTDISRVSKNKDEIVETITKSKAWVCGKDQPQPLIIKPAMQVEEKLTKVSINEDKIGSNEMLKSKEDENKTILEDSVKPKEVALEKCIEVKDQDSQPTAEIEKSNASYLETQILEVDSQEGTLPLKEDDAKLDGESKIEALTETVKQPEVPQQLEIPTATHQNKDSLSESEASQTVPPVSTSETVLLEPKQCDTVELNAKLEVKEKVKLPAVEVEPKRDENLKTELAEPMKDDTKQHQEPKSEAIIDTPKLVPNQSPKPEIVQQEIKVETLEIPKVEIVEISKVEPIKFPKEEETIVVPKLESKEIPKAETVEIKKAEPVETPKVAVDIGDSEPIETVKATAQDPKVEITKPSVAVEKTKEPLITESISRSSVELVAEPQKILVQGPPESIKPLDTKKPEDNLHENISKSGSFPQKKTESKSVVQDTSAMDLTQHADDKIPANSSNTASEKEISENKVSESKPHQPTITIAQTPSVVNTPDIAPPQKNLVKESIAKPSILGLVSYGSSSEDEDAEDLVVKPKEALPSESVVKRKAEESLETVSKIPKLTDDKPAEKVFNPIVGEAVEEEMIIITGEGSGAQNEGGNDEVEVDSNHKENISNGNNEASKKVDLEKGSNNKSENVDSSSEDDDDESQESLEVKPRGRRGRPSGSTKKKPGPKSAGEKKPRSAPGRPRGGRSEVAKLGVPLDSLEVNGSGDNERPVRASRRIAQIRQKEEEERRQLEEERLAQLKAAQLRKKLKQAEAAKLKVGEEGGKVPKVKGIKSAKTKHTDYMPSPSASDSNSAEDEGDDYEHEEEAKPKGKKKKKRGKNGRHKAGNPWATSSDDEDSEAVEEEEEYHYEEEEQLVFNESDHEFSPESEVDEDADAAPSRHARTAKRGEVNKDEETGCRKCGKGDHPEWILLCDKCDHGWHASCLKPQLWVIPEGEWFCPPCQHNLLVSKMNENLIEFDKLFKRRENDILRKQRLAYVGISLNNVLPTPEKEEKVEEKKHSDDRGRWEKKSRRRIILSDEEISDNNFIDDNSRGGGSGGGSSDEDSDGPIYRLRTRRGAKSFDQKAYDEMINSAIRASDEEMEEIAAIEEEAGEENEGIKVNGDDEEKEPVEVEHAGKNEAFEKHLQEQEVETDEELLGEKERLKRREKKKAAQKKKKRSFRDLDDYTDEDNSDEDFKGSDAEDDEEKDEDAVEEDESEWSGDKDDSDDSIAARSRSRGKKGKYGRREQYLEVGTVRRSTRRRQARISYDETDEEGEEEGEDKWNSEESDAEETPSESDDETYGKRKKQKKVPARSAVPRFFLGTIGSSSKSPAKKSSTKKKKRRVDEDDVDRAWSSSQGSKAKKKAAEETVERRTRGRKINFKDILDSGESDDDGNIRPKRRRISSGSDEEASTSRRLAEEIKAANQREHTLYIAAQQKQGGTKKSDSVPASVPSSLEDESEFKDKEDKKQMPLLKLPTASSEPSNLLESSSSSSNADKPSTLELEMALAKPVPAPPIPPALAKALGRSNKSSRTPAGSGEKSSSKSPSASHIPVSSNSNSDNISNANLPSVPGVPSIISITGSANISTMPSITGMPHLSTSTITTSSKKGGGSTTSSVSSGSPPMKPSLTPPMTIGSPMRPIPSPHQQPPHGVLSQGLPQGMPLDISRVPNPSLYQGNPAMRPYHPMWVRNPGPPPYGPGGVPPSSIGKPPPLNSTAFMGQHGPPRPGYPSPPPLRIPNPNTSPLQAFQHFKRDPPHGPGMYRMPPGQGGLPGLLAGGLVPHQGPPERFFGAPSPYPPYNLLPPHTQAQPPPQSLFTSSQFDFRPGDHFKNDERRGTPPGPSSPPSSQPPASSTGATKEEPSQQQESEFGGLVSYFSSQRSEEDMDT